MPPPGCNTSGPASLADARGTTIAFESIEGPAAQVVQKFERDINEEAAARQIAVVPRGGTAPIASAAISQPNAGPEAPSIAWAWDVYDADQRRAFRLSGVEPSGTGRQSSAGFWAAADDAVLRKDRTRRHGAARRLYRLRPRAERRPRASVTARRAAADSLGAGRLTAAAKNPGTANEFDIASRGAALLSGRRALASVA